MTDIHRWAFVALAAGLTSAASLQAQTSSPVVPVTPVGRMTLATARIIHIVSHTDFVKQAELEKALLQRKEFEPWGLVLTRDQNNADVILEVKRVPFQSHFPYSVIDRRTKVVLAAGEVNSLGGTAHGKIASQLLEKMKAARERAGAK